MRFFKSIVLNQMFHFDEIIFTFNLFNKKFQNGFIKYMK